MKNNKLKKTESIPILSDNKTYSNVDRVVIETYLLLVLVFKNRRQKRTKAISNQIKTLKLNYVQGVSSIL